MHNLQITVKDYCEIITSCKPDSYETLLDYDTLPGCSNKRITKAVSRTIGFVKEMVEEGSLPDKVYFLLQLMSLQLSSLVGRNYALARGRP